MLSILRVSLILSIMLINLNSARGILALADDETSALDANTCNCTHFDNSLFRVLRRKKRFVIFPPGAHILATLSVLKVIPDGRPRGLQLSVELDQIHPLPEELNWWLPKPLQNAEAEDKADAFQDYQYTGKNSFVYTLDNPERFNQKKSEYNPQQFWKENRKWKWTPPEPLPPPGRRVPVSQSWPHYQDHRERREIYRKLESMGTIFSLDIRSCILRTICEVKHYLLPPGVSMVQDIVRIVFTTPYHEELRDDYNTAGDLDDEQTCHDVHKANCPVSLLEYFLLGERTI